MINEFEEKDVQAKLQLIADFKNTFGTQEGKRVLNKLISLSNYKHSKMTDYPIDPYRVVADEAQRSVICYILKMVESKFDQEPNEKAIT